MKKSETDTWQSTGGDVPVYVSENQYTLLNIRGAFTDVGVNHSCCSNTSMVTFEMCKDNPFPV